MAYPRWGTPRCVPPHTALKIVAAPSVEPFDLGDAKRLLRIVSDDEDDDVKAFVRAARAQVERDTGRALLTQTWDLFLDDGPTSGWVTVPRPPLQSVTVNSTDTLGAESVWSASNYVVDTASEPGRIGLIDGGNWPSGLRTFQPMRVRFVAGWTTPELIPADLRAAVGLLVGWFAENRQPAPFEAAQYDRLIAPYVIFSAA